MRVGTGTPTPFLTGHVDQALIDYVETRLSSAALAADHAMVWIDVADDATIRVAIEYGMGRDRVCVEASGTSIAPVADECVERLVRHAASAPNSTAPRE
jgi:hypothetical protein